jgi:hypothetical protein
MKTFEELTINELKIMFDRVYMTSICIDHVIEHNISYKGMTIEQMKEEYEKHAKFRNRIEVRMDEIYNEYMEIYENPILKRLDERIKELKE